MVRRPKHVRRAVERSRLGAFVGFVAAQGVGFYVIDGDAS